MSKQQGASYLLCVLIGAGVMIAGYLITGTRFPWWEPLLMLEVPTHFYARLLMSISKD